MSAFTVNKTSGKFQIFMFIVSINQVSDTGSSEPLVYATQQLKDRTINVQMVSEKYLLAA
jgi:hypothetical protein